MDYARAFDPHRYSSGEAVMASSDAQNVDYGVIVDHARHFVAGSPADACPPAFEFNGLPESRVSDYGSVAYPFGNVRVKKEKPVSVAIREKLGGVRATAGFTRGVIASGETVGSATRPPDAILNSGGTLAGQKETAAKRVYIGQLGSLK